ncbi:MULTISPECIES: site-specific DNA-methyltransferase [unclassified Pseudomonas]|uniref:DNA-methyltransferase n=1 Tax=unclassified Pseudomonas TaxID=196821 RepID=UPI00244CE50B|nr:MULTISPECIES: site-specific DNA-methyltransferase [unclassified Pseudomonas]MDG9927456.1 site-specific DNA-methyltransferase [Pseudomonas sp. GD04042]MDH0482525.1 site-specific DNA-methyltransferase [Pseudomonas sp. GD04015]MDH0602877.1 site-specific DNA-methyltransferase [Pseudomonas sp. GD03869]
MTPPFTLHRGDCLEVLRTFHDNSIDSIVTDPPYGVSFMGNRWDCDVPAVEVWAECLRVLKPGGYLLAFGGTRTYHRLATRIEDAGFVLHPMLAWVFGQGFPKATRVPLDGMEGWRYGLQSLKPAIEPIAMAQKTFSEKTGAANIARWGVGAVNIDACRVPAEPMPPNTGAGGLPRRSEDERRGPGTVAQPSELGRWPANLIHDGSAEVLAGFPAEAGAVAPVHRRNSDKTRTAYGAFAGNVDEEGSTFQGDSGSAARFFYCPKASRTDRNEGCEHLARKPLNWSSGEANPGSFQSEGTDKTSQNNHPTVKPTDLMAYLCRLVTPPGGVVLDPFMGSGSTGKAAVREGFEFVGIELEPEYLAIAEARIEFEWRRTLERARAEQQRGADAAARDAQLDIFTDSQKEPAA